MRRFTTILLGILMVSGVGCTQKSDQAEEQSIVVYAGRSKSLVDATFEKFREETGIQVEVRYASTSELAIALAEEGEATRADIFWAQDAGALGSVSAAGMLELLPEDVQAAVPDHFRSQSGDWIAVSGRARTLAYSPEHTKGETLPSSVFDLTSPQYKDRVGWAPLNASFHSFVSAMRTLHGDEITREWLVDMKSNGAKSFSNNSSIVRGIADGEVDVGLPNHYYLLRFKNEDADFPVEQTFFSQGDAGNLLNIAGVGILRTSESKGAALSFVRFLLSTEMQSFFVETTFEYPVTDSAAGPTGMTSAESLESLRPSIDLNALRDLDATMRMLRDANIL